LRTATNEKQQQCSSLATEAVAGFLIASQKFTAISTTGSRF